MSVPGTDEWGLVPEDDMFHPPPVPDPWWTETVWFSWMVPERAMLGYWYVVLRANLGVTFGGVLLVDDRAVLPWEIPVFDWHWHDPMHPSVDLCDLDVMGGMWLRCTEPGRGFRFGYENDEVVLDLEFRALMQPMLTRHEPPFDHGTHVDQPGHVRGHMRLDGEDIDVDCIAMRDRSWGLRVPRRQPKLGYCHATAGADSGFLVITVDRRGVDGLVRGYLMRDGEWANLVTGHRTVERDAHGRPARIVVEGVDERGRALTAHGTTVSRQVFTAYPDMFCWNSLTRWEYDGLVAWGEDQDIWHPRRWREFARGIGATVR